MAGQKLSDGFARRLGFDLRAPGEVRMEVRPEHVNGVGKLLGPIGFALVDYAMTGAAVAATEQDELVVTVNVAINFVAGVSAGEVRCGARVDRRTRTIASLSAAVRDEDDGLLITAVGLFAIRPAPPGHR